MTALALAVVALGSALQVALYLHRFGADHRTDGFIAAFAVYSLVVVIAQILRTTAAPLLSGSTPVVAGGDFGWAVALLAVTAAVMFAALSGPLGHVLAGAAGPAGRQVAGRSLRIMAPAMGLQICGAGLAVAGGARDRLIAVSVAYIASAIAGLIGFIVLLSTAHELVLAWAMLVASIVLVGVLVGMLRPQLRRPPPAARALTVAARLLRSTPLPASFVAMYPIALALFGPAPPGELTLFGLSFTACSYLAGFTGQALSMVDVYTFADLDADSTEQRHALIARSFRYSTLAATPGLAIAVLVGEPIVHTLLTARGSHSASASGFGLDLLLLAPWLVATLGLWAVMPAVLVRLGRPGAIGVARPIIALFAVHVSAVLVGRALAGYHGVIVAMFAAPAAFTVAGLRAVCPSAGRDLIRDGSVIGGAGVLAFGAPGLLARAVGGGGLAGGVAASAVGALSYLVLARRAYPGLPLPVIRATRR